MTLPAAEVASLARTLEVAPALARTAVRSAARIGGGAPTIRRAVGSLAEVIIGKPLAGGAGRTSAEAFVPELATADLDLGSLAERLARAGTRRVSASAATARPAPARVRSCPLARRTRMGLDVLHKRASDLFSMWLGCSERTLWTLRWIEDLDVRRITELELNKGEICNALARAVYLHRLERFRDRSLESQTTRAAAMIRVSAHSPARCSCPSWLNT